MNSFKDFGITPATKGFTGDKIKIRKLLNKKIIVHDYKIEQSKFEGTRLDMQVEIDGERHVTWTSSKFLHDTIQQIDKSRFPFETTIIEVNESFQFS